MSVLSPIPRQHLVAAVAGMPAAISAAALALAPPCPPPWGPVSDTPTPRCSRCTLTQASPGGRQPPPGTSVPPGPRVLPWLWGPLATAPGCRSQGAERLWKPWRVSARRRHGATVTCFRATSTRGGGCPGRCGGGGAGGGAELAGAGLAAGRGWRGRSWLRGGAGGGAGLAGAGLAAGRGWRGRGWRRGGAGGGGAGGGKLRPPRSPEGAALLRKGL